MAPKTARQQIATLPIQVPPKEHFSLLDINLKCIECRGQALYAKLRIEKETVDQFLARLVKGEEERGGCTFVCKQNQRGKNVEGKDWRLNCCFGDHDKSARKAAASESQPRLFKEAEGKAPNTPTTAAVQKVQTNDGGQQEVKKERRKKLVAGQSIKVGCKFVLIFRTTHAEPGVLIVRVADKDHVDENGHPAHPQRKRPDLSDETKDWVYEKLLSGTPARTIIDGMIAAALCVAALLCVFWPQANAFWHTTPA
jgi:mRNA-degrading endonuclease RelE of RelBE toxin-antitoxin system